MTDRGPCDFLCCLQILGRARTLARVFEASGLQVGGCQSPAGARGFDVRTHGNAAIALLEGSASEILCGRSVAAGGAVSIAQERGHMA